MLVPGPHDDIVDGAGRELLQPVAGPGGELRAGVRHRDRDVLPQLLRAVARARRLGQAGERDAAGGGGEAGGAAGGDGKILKNNVMRCLKYR